MRAEDGGKQKDGTGGKLEEFALIDHLDSAVLVQGAKPPHPMWESVRAALAGGVVLGTSDLRAACGVEDSKGPG
jgi:hypothetical protein